MPPKCVQNAKCDGPLRKIITMSDEPTPVPILMGMDNPDGYKLEDLAQKLIDELIKKNSRLEKDITINPITLAVYQSNQLIMEYLYNIIRCQMSTKWKLDTLGPDQGPRGKPRI